MELKVVEGICTMGKMNAAEMTYYIAKAGDLVKGKGNGDMNTGAKVIIASAIIVGGAAVIAGQKVAKMLSKKKNKTEVV